MTDKQLCDAWIRLNAPYAARANHGAAAPNSVSYYYGNNPHKNRVVITAPHAVRHERDSLVKKADLWTGGLCALLSQLTNCTAITAAGYVKQWHSWTERSDDFKDALTQAVADNLIVLDMHGMRDLHGVDVCLGLGPNPSARVYDIAHQIQAALSPLRISINQPFAATKAYTVTSYVQSIGGEGLQVEIATHLRNPAKRMAEAAAFARSMAEVIGRIDT